MYAAASITATTMAGTFDTAEATRHSRFAGFETALKRASTEYRETRGKCDDLARTKRNLCNAEARSDERRAFLRDTDRQGNDAMNWDRIEGNWKQFKGTSRSSGASYDDQLDVIAGKRDS